MANEITFKILKDGSRELIHPSGIKVIETKENRDSLRQEIVLKIDGLTKELAKIDFEEENITTYIRENFNG